MDVPEYVIQAAAAARIAVGILALAVGCNVTRSEHALLSPYDRTHFGWQRYVEAGVEVIDTTSGAPADVTALAIEQRAAVARLGLSDMLP